MFSRHSSKTSLILSDLKQNVIKKPIVNYTKQGKIKVQNSPHRMTESFQNVCNKSNMISDYNSNSHKKFQLFMSSNHNLKPKPFRRQIQSFSTSKKMDRSKSHTQIIGASHMMPSMF